jgi:hypothetical protein
MHIVLYNYIHIVIKYMHIDQYKAHAFTENIIMRNLLTMYRPCHNRKSDGKFFEMLCWSACKKRN